MHRIWIYVMAFIGGIVVACSNDVTETHDENNSSSDTDIVIIELSSSSKKLFEYFFPVEQDRHFLFHQKFIIDRAIVFKQRKKSVKQFQDGQVLIQFQGNLL